MSTEDDQPRRDDQAVDDEPERGQDDAPAQRQQRRAPRDRQLPAPEVNR